jgi:hypothetical protein
VRYHGAHAKSVTGRSEPVSGAIGLIRLRPDEDPGRVTATHGPTTVAANSEALMIRRSVRSDGVGRLELLPAHADGLDHAIGRLLSIVFTSQQDRTWSRLKACAECQWALYDHTKNRSAAWCGSQCGARVRSRRHRRRHRKDSA